MMNDPLQYRLPAEVAAAPAVKVGTSGVNLSSIRFDPWIGWLASVFRFVLVGHVSLRQYLGDEKRDEIRETTGEGALIVASAVPVAPTERVNAEVLSKR